jgi:non-ribosomal peptide synthetase component E (peptide arylation enzyme)
VYPPNTPQSLIAITGAFKVPKVIDFTDEIPVTPIGKVDKRSLRKPADG